MTALYDSQRDLPKSGIIGYVYYKYGEDHPSKIGKQVKASGIVFAIPIMFTLSWTLFLRLVVAEVQIVVVLLLLRCRSDILLIILRDDKLIVVKG